MFPYTVKDTEFESDVQNNKLLHKINPKCQNTIETSQHFRKVKKKSNNFKNTKVLFCRLYNSNIFCFLVYFVTFVYFGIFAFCVFVLDLAVTINSAFNL